MSRYLTPVVMIQSVSAFIILRTIGERLSNASLRARNLLRIISEASFGMYLIHPIWRDMLHMGCLVLPFMAQVLKAKNTRVEAIEAMTSLEFCLGHLEHREDVFA